MVSQVNQQLDNQTEKHAKIVDFCNVVYTGWSDVTTIYVHATISML